MSRRRATRSEQYAQKCTNVVSGHRAIHELRACFCSRAEYCSLLLNRPEGFLDGAETRLETARGLPEVGGFLAVRLGVPAGIRPQTGASLGLIASVQSCGFSGAVVS